MSEYRLDMSVKTPILITPSEYWAYADPLARTAARTAKFPRIFTLVPPWLGPFGSPQPDSPIVQTPR
jgi:hypothetical protein